MKSAVCTTIENYHILAENHVPYIELAGSAIAAMDEATFAQVVETVNRGTVKCCGFNAALPPHIVLCGEGFDLAAVEEYFTLLCQRGQALGIATIGVGSPKSRRYHHGDDLELAWAQVTEFMTKAAEVAAPYHITVMYEALNQLECDFGLSLRDGVDLVEKLNLDNLKLVYDIFHSQAEGETLEDLAVALPYIRHVHIAERVGDQRAYPTVARRGEYADIFATLQAGGYDGLVSAESFYGDVGAGVASFVAMMNQ